MTRKPVRVLMMLMGACLFFGALVSLLLWLGSSQNAWARPLTDFSAVIDIVALAIWLLIFSFYWARHPD